MSVKNFKAALKNSFVNGLSSFVTGNYQITVPSDNISDSAAIRDDWKKVGEYLNWGIRNYEQKYRDDKRSQTRSYC